MDYIEVVDQRIYGYHGVLEEEKEAGQEFFVSFKAYLSIDDAAEHDDMLLSVSYADMCKTVKQVVTEQSYDLIETVADKAAKSLLLNYDRLDRVVLTVKKPSAPVGEPVAYPAVCVDRGWHKAYIGLGSNMGDSTGTINHAIDVLNEDPLTKVIDRSTVIETKPWGNEDQPNFKNAVISVKTLASPRQLMTRLMAVEKSFGRERDVKWGPRTLDLDILLYDDETSDDPYVTLPHPLMDKRTFVLKPMCEIGANVVHPILGKRICTLLKELELNE